MKNHDNAEGEANALAARTIMSDIGRADLSEAIMNEPQSTLAGSGRAIAYVASFRKTGDTVRITFGAFPDEPIDVPATADLERLARTQLNALLRDRIEGRRVIPAPAANPRRSGNAEVFQQTIVPDQTIAMKSLLWDEMRSQGVSNSELARRLGVDEKEVRRLLDPESTHGRRLGDAIEMVIGAPVAVTIVDGSRPERIMRAPGQTHAAPIMNLVPAFTAPATTATDE